MDDDQTATLDPDSQEVLDQIARDNDQPVLNSEARKLSVFPVLQFNSTLFPKIDVSNR